MFTTRVARALSGVLVVLTVGACAGPEVQDVASKGPAPAPLEAQVQQVDVEVGQFGQVGQIPPHVLASLPPSGKAIVVNIPSFELIAFEDRKPVLRSRVIIGTPRTQTPVMRTETSVVRFRPTWTPTPSMIAKGIRPGTRPGGKGNPLGYLAIRLEPGMLIYLHGTNKPQLFEREMRALSHGCVRVERWDEVAAWVLGIPLDAVHGHAYGRRTFDMGTSGVPVLVTYLTEFPDASGKLRSWPDIYRRGTMATAPAVQGAL